MPNIQLDTSFHVPIEAEAASIAERYVAGFIDLGIIVTYMIVAQWGLYTVLGYMATPLRDAWSIAALGMLIQLPALLYPLICETWSKGYSVGKYLMKMKVVSADGQALQWSQCAIRWIFFPVDALLSVSVVGLMSMLLSAKLQRIGDRAAGTVVLKTHRLVKGPPALPSEDEAPQYQVQLPLVVRLSDADMQRIRVAYQRALAQSDETLLQRLAEKIEAVTGQNNPFGQPKKYIETCIADYRFLTSK